MILINVNENPIVLNDENLDYNLNNLDEEDDLLLAEYYWFIWYFLWNLK